MSAQGRWHKHGDKWLVSIAGERVTDGTTVTVVKANGASEAKRVSHSKRCGCNGTQALGFDGAGHLYYVARTRHRTRYTSAAIGI